MTLGVSAKAPSADLTKPSSSCVSSGRRAVGRASPAPAATSLSVMLRAEPPRHVMMSSPRASASTKSGCFPRPATTSLRSSRAPTRSAVAEEAPTGAVRGVGLVGRVLVRVVEHLVVRQVGVHPLRARLLAERAAQVLHRGVDIPADRARVEPD